MKKSQLVLLLYNELCSEQGVNMDEFMNEHNIALSTYRRYISDINIYLSDTFSGKSVVYITAEKKYKIM